MDLTNTLPATRWSQRGVLLSEWLVGLVLGALTGVVMLQVIARFAFQVSLPWTMDVAGLLLVWATFLGAAVASFSDENFAVGFVVDALPDRFRPVAELVGNLAVIVTLAALLVYGLRYSLLQTSQLYPGIAISKAWGAAAIPVSAVLMLLRYFSATRVALTKFRAGAQGEQGTACSSAARARTPASHGDSK